MTDLIFLDTETTGLEDDKHAVWEIAYAINDGEIQSHVVVHSLMTADPAALEINKYYERFPDGARSRGPQVDLMIREILKGNTLVCSNPSFDRGFLKARWKESPWHHRSVDISSFAMPLLGHDRPMGLATVAAELRSMGYEIPWEDHSAAGDVRAMRECYWALRTIQKRFHDWMNYPKKES